MGDYFQTNALLDTTLDVDQPDVLVYETKPDGARNRATEFPPSLPRGHSAVARSHYSPGSERVSHGATRVQR